jgi:hypothetical protein
MIIFFAEHVVFVFIHAIDIEYAKQFLTENLNEIIAYAARIHDLVEFNLYNAISRQKKNEDIKHVFL